MEIENSGDIYASEEYLKRLIDSLWSVYKTSGKEVKCTEKIGCNGMEPCWACVLLKAISYLRFELACRREENNGDS